MCAAADVLVRGRQDANGGSCIDEKPPTGVILLDEEQAVLLVGRRSYY